MSRAPSGEPHALVLGVAYDGAAYRGFVVQREQRTVAGELLKAIQAFDPAVSKLRVASRTDSGVHARQQVTAFDTGRVLPLRAWVLGLQRLLPTDVAIHSAERAPLGWHPRFEAKRKRYRYLLHCARLPEPLLAHRVWRVHALEGIDDATVQVMADELAGCHGTHDFKGFAAAADERVMTVRSMFATRVQRVEGLANVVALDIEGDGFLHNMVRILVGTVVDVALGRAEPGAIRRTLASGARHTAGQTAPPDGLYLETLTLTTPLLGERWPPHAP